MLSVIVPVYYRHNDSYIVERAKQIIKKFQNRDGFELIIADSSKASCLKSDAANVKIIHSYKSEKYFSPAMARNEAVVYASNKYLFFFDVDLDYDDGFESILFSEITSELESGKNNFLMIPCLYLSKKGTDVFSHERDTASLMESLLKGESYLVLRLAVNTSALIVEKDYFLKIGQFSTDFQGHGGEDFELIHRLSAFNPHAKKNVDYYTDRVEQFPADYVGFRRYMSCYALPLLFKGLILVHRWHERPLTNRFYFRRKPNESLLQSKMRHFDRAHPEAWNSDKELIPMQKYIIDLMNQYGYTKEQYPGLFSYKAGVVRPKNTNGAKVRKLLTRPKEFFLDSKPFKVIRRWGKR